MIPMRFISRLDVTDDDIVTNTAEAGTEDGSAGWMIQIELFIDADYSRISGRDSAFQFEGRFVLTPNGLRDNEANNPLFGEDLTGLQQQQQLILVIR